MRQRGGSCAVTRSIDTYIDRDFALSREPRGHPCSQDHRERVSQRTMVREAAWWVWQLARSTVGTGLHLSTRGVGCTINTRKTWSPSQCVQRDMLM